MTPADGGVTRGAMIAGLFEAIAIVRYDVLVSDLSWDRLLAGLGWMLAIVALHLLAWTAMAIAFDRLVGRWSFNLCFSVWAGVVVLGRHLLDDRTVVGGRWWLGIALLLVWMIPEVRWWRDSSAARASLRAAGILTIGAYGLLGRIPDATFLPSKRLAYLITSATVALVIVTALRRVPRAVTIGLAVLLVGVAVTGLIAPADTAPNVLWILVDTARRDHTSPWSSLVWAPATAKLAAEGIRFDDAVTVVPKTPASVASFFTAQYPIHHGVRSLYDSLGEEAPTLAEAFQRAGYDTRAFVDNAYLSRGRGFGQGFDEFRGYYEIDRPYGPLRYSSWVVLADRLTRRSIRAFDGQTSARKLTDTVLDSLRRRRSQRRPFFTYVHYFEPHWPYLPPPKLAVAHGAPADGRCEVNQVDEIAGARGAMIFQNKFPDRENEAGRRLYRAEMEDTLNEVGRLIEGLDARGLRESTLVVFTADHGHALGDHNYYFHHGEFLYESSLRIPLILRWPGQLPAGIAVGTQVRSIDVAPTVANLLRLATFPRGDGQSLLPLLSAEVVGPAGTTPAFIESDVKMFSANTRREIDGLPGKLRAIRDGKHKLIVTPRRDRLSFELYDLIEDPEETRDLAGDPAYAEVRRRLESQLMSLIPAPERAMLAQIVGIAGERPSSLPPPEPAPKPDPDQMKMLRSLGYVE